MTSEAIAVVGGEEPSAGPRIAKVLGGFIFAMLVVLVMAAVIPYGTVESWWKGAFLCVVFLLGICAIVERLLSGEVGVGRGSLLLPPVVLAAFAFLQTIPMRSVTNGGSGLLAPWNAISADPYQTRFFALELLALTIALTLLYRYAASERRIRVLIYVVISVAVASAVFGILRQTTQHAQGFLLPLLKPAQGYGQFINRNHFAFLMEMALGLGLGLIVAGGVKRDRIAIYFAALLLIWTGLVLANSRGGVLAMLAEFVVAALLFTSVVSTSRADITQMRLLNLARSVGLRIVLLLVLVGGVVFGTLLMGGDRLITSFEAVSGEFNPGAGGLHEGATRNEIWRATWRMFAAHPILGVGLGGYWVGITAYHDASGTLTPQEAHNEYLELLSSGGLIGFALGVWFAVVLFRLIRENLIATGRFRRAACFGAALGIAGVAVHSLVDFGLHMLGNAMLFVVLVMIATARIDRETPVRSSRRELIVNA